MCHCGRMCKRDPTNEAAKKEDSNGQSRKALTDCLSAKETKSITLGDMPGDSN